MVKKVEKEEGGRFTWMELDRAFPSSLFERLTGTALNRPLFIQTRIVFHAAKWKQKGRKRERQSDRGVCKKKTKRMKPLGGRRKRNTQKVDEGAWGNELRNIEFKVDFVKLALLQPPYLNLCNIYVVLKSLKYVYTHTHLIFLFFFSILFHFLCYKSNRSYSYRLIQRLLFLSYT